MTNEQRVMLLNALDDLKGKVLLSGYESALYSKLPKGLAGVLTPPCGLHICNDPKSLGGQLPHRAFLGQLVSTRNSETPRFRRF